MQSTVENNYRGNKKVVHAILKRPVSVTPPLFVDRILDTNLDLQCTLEMILVLFYIFKVAQ